MGRRGASAKRFSRRSSSTKVQRRLCCGGRQRSALSISWREDWKTNGGLLVATTPLIKFMGCFVRRKYVVSFCDSIRKILKQLGQTERELTFSGQPAEDPSRSNRDQVPETP